MSLPKTTLRYFNCHGRVQHLRYYLLAREMAFVDDRIPLDENWASWEAIKDDTSKTGQFHKLPLLQWADQSLSESSVIHDWIHQNSGDAESLSEEENLHHAMLSSSCMSELMLPMGMLLWVEVSHPGVDLKQQVQATLPKVKDHLALLETILTEWNWWKNLSKRKIMLADCLLWQQIWVACHLFGEAVGLEDLDELSDFYLFCKKREVFETLIDAYPMQLTGRPEEGEVIKRIRACL